MTELFLGLLLTGGTFAVIVGGVLWLGHWNRLHHPKR